MFFLCRLILAAFDDKAQYKCQTPLSWHVWERQKMNFDAYFRLNGYSLTQLSNPVWMYFGLYIEQL